MIMATTEDLVSARFAKASDWPAIVGLVDCAESQLEHDKEMVKKSLFQGLSEVILVEKLGTLIGGTAGRPQPSQFKTELYYSVMFVMMVPGYGRHFKDMLYAVEQCLMRHDFTVVTYAVPAEEFYYRSDALARFFVSMDYKPLETQYYRRLEK